MAKIMDLTKDCDGNPLKLHDLVECDGAHVTINGVHNGRITFRHEGRYVSVVADHVKLIKKSESP